MSSASELYRSGDLAGAIKAQSEAVRDEPGDANRRLFLFELLAFAGDLDRARKQLALVQYDDPQLVMALNNYKFILDAEQKRRAALAGGPPPRFSGETPPEHVTMRWKAAQLMHQGKKAEAMAAAEEADNAAPAYNAQVNGRRATRIRDIDDIFGSVVEVFAKGDYFWMGVEQISMLATNEPAAPRDLLYMPARMELHSGDAGDVYLPVLYPNSHAAEDAAVRLGNLTDFQEDGQDGPLRGRGRRTFDVQFEDGTEEVSLLEWRHLVIEPSETPRANLA